MVYADELRLAADDVLTTILIHDGDLVEFAAVDSVDTELDLRRLVADTQKSSAHAAYFNSAAYTR